MAFSTWLTFFTPARAIPLSPGPGATLGFTGVIAMSCYTSLASRILGLLRRLGHIRWMNRSLGSLFILAGTVLASFSHKA